MNNNFPSESNLRDMITIAPGDMITIAPGVIDNHYLRPDNFDWEALASADMGSDEDYGGGHMYPDDGDYDSSSDF